MPSLPHAAGVPKIPCLGPLQGPKDPSCPGEHSRAGWPLSPGASQSPQPAGSPNLFPDSWAPPGLTAIAGEEVMEKSPLPTAKKSCHLNMVIFLGLKGDPCLLPTYLPKGKELSLRIVAISLAQKTSCRHHGTKVTIQSIPQQCKHCTLFIKIESEPKGELNIRCWPVGQWSPGPWVGRDQHHGEGQE